MNQVRTKRDGISEASLRGEKLRCLMIHFNEENLTKCFYELDGKKAVGVDQVSKRAYEENLEENIKSLHQRLKTMSYRPQPSREVLIPKTDGGTRPLAISTLEDKIVQLMFKKILDAVYEPIFLDCSFGFRSGRGAHDAIFRLNRVMYSERTWHILDVDLANFFGEIPHGKLISVLGMKIQDQRFLRYITRLLKAGVLSTSGLKRSEHGSPQGSICSPVLANIYAHHCIDVWFEKTVRPRLYGRGEVIRYADDFCLCLTDERDVERVWKALQGRLSRFGLQINANKSKTVTYDKQRPDYSTRGVSFLGFELRLQRSRKGFPVIKILSSKKTISRSIREITRWLKSSRNRLPFKLLWEGLCQKLRGHIAYFGISGNLGEVSRVIYRAHEAFFKWVNRRSQKRSINRDEFKLFLARHPLPHPRPVLKLF